MAKCGFLQDFKAFAMRGNVVDMAVGVIIGGAFGKIVASVVNDVLMPPIGWLIGGVKFDELKYELPVNPLNPDLEPVTINYGAFCQACIDFLIIAFCVFLLVRGITRLTAKKEEPAAPAPAPEPSAEEKLLKEIRDLLKDKK